MSDLIKARLDLILEWFRRLFFLLGNPLAQVFRFFSIARRGPAAEIRADQSAAAAAAFIR